MASVLFEHMKQVCVMGDETDRREKGSTKKMYKRVAHNVCHFVSYVFDGTFMRNEIKLRKLCIRERQTQYTREFRDKLAL